MHRFLFARVSLENIPTPNHIPACYGCIITGVECGDLPMTASSNRSQPRVAVLSREVGGRAAFSCKLGFGIRGPSESICLPSGEWATPFPTCVGRNGEYGNSNNLIKI